MRSFAKVSSFCLFPAFLLLAACLAKPAASAVWVVDPEGSGDATTIQGGIDLASVGDVVQVRPGIYSDTHSAFPPWGERIVNVEMKPGVRVESTDGPAETVIDGAAKTAQYGVYFPEGCAADCALVGFSIDHSQVGTYVNAGSPTIRENLFLNNMFEGVQMWLAAPTIEFNTFFGLPLYGVRVQQVESQPTVRNNIFAEIETWAVFCAGSQVTLDCNLFWNNARDYDGDCDYQDSDVLSDPAFCDAAAGDYTLHEGSPALPENSDCGGMGAFGVGCGPTPVLETSWGKIKHAFDFHR